MESKKVVLVSLLVVAAFSFVPVAAHSLSHNSGAMFRENFSGVGLTSTQSENWAGYAVTGGNYTVSNVTESFVVPTVDTGGNSYAAFWVGIDGFNDGTVEQTGILAEPSGHGPHASTVYLVWYEFYPAAPVYASFDAAPGDLVYASVNYSQSSGIFTTYISVSNSDGQLVGTFGHNQSVTGAQADSAEWIVEAPSSSSGVLPLANFGTAHFGKYYTDYTNTNYATVNGTYGSIGSFNNVTSIVMVSSNGTPEATPSALFDSGTSFNVTYDQKTVHGHGLH